MNENSILSLVKARLGITTAVRDDYLTSIVKAVLRELTDEKGIVLKEDDDNHLLFCCDYAAWRYLSRDESGAMPLDLRFRLHNLMIHAGGKS